MAERDPITDRIDAALERAALRGWVVRAIYLDEQDREALTTQATRDWQESTGSDAVVHPLGYERHPIVSKALAIGHFGDHEVRAGNVSKIYSDRGCGIAIPKRLSPRTRKAR